MAITNYTQLQTAVANFSHRSDLTSIIPDLIRLAEDVIYGDIDSRQQDTSGTLNCVASTETVTLPTDFIDMKSLTVSSSTPHGTIDYLAPDQYKQSFQYGNTGVPRVYTIIGNALYLQPIPDQAYTLNAVYEAKLTNLSTGAPVNWLLTSYPSIYLYASLMQAAIYMEDDAMQAKWGGMYTDSLSGINANDWASGNTLAVKTDVSLTNFRP